MAGRHGHGTLYAAQFPADSGVDFYQRALQRYQEKLEARPALYDQVKITHLGPPEHTEHPAGVWTFPPTLRLGEENRARYLEIGESDRMTLRFRKPE